jgi:transcriptional regulator with XRE-family HTH domain
MQNNELASITDVDMALVTSCRNAREALSRCIRLSGLSDETVADRLGITKGYLSKVLNGRAQLDGDRRIRVMHICGNALPLQYEAWSLGRSMMLRDPKDMLAECMALLAKVGARA